MHPGILALNQLAAATGIQNFDELNDSIVSDDFYDMIETCDPKYVYFRDHKQEIIQILPERSRSAYFCDHNNCIIAELDEAAVICTKYGYIAYDIKTNQRVYSKGNK